MSMRTTLAGLIAAGLLTAALPAAAIEAIPESCLRCKGLQDDGKFVMCLYDCLGSVKLDAYRKDDADRPTRSNDASTPEANRNQSGHESNGPSVAGWTTKEIEQPDGTVGRIAMIDSGDAFPFFFERVEPTLLIMKEGKDDTQIVIDVRPAAATGFSDRLLIQVDDEKIRSYPLQTIWNGHAAVIRDESLLKAIRRGRELHVRMDVFGAGTQTFGFRLKGSEKILRWIDDADQLRS